MAVAAWVKQVQTAVVAMFFSDAAMLGGLH
jgi:hypothetical protein